MTALRMDDLWAGRFDPRQTLRAFDPRRPAVALSHDPDTVDLGAWEGFNGWILSGHTHGGQCKAPFLPPPLLPVKNRRYSVTVFKPSETQEAHDTQAPRRGPRLDAMLPPTTQSSDTPSPPGQIMVEYT